MGKYKFLLRILLLNVIFIILFYILSISCSVVESTPQSEEDEVTTKNHEISINIDVNDKIIEPYLIFTGNNTEAMLQWRLSDIQQCIIEWGIDESYSTGNAIVSEYSIEHFYSYKITSLSPLTKYYYRIITSTNNFTGTFFTQNLSNNNKNVNFFVFGDAQGDNIDIENIIMQSIVNTYNSNPDYQTFMINTGDLVDNGNDENSWMNNLFNKDLQALQIAMKNIFLITCRSNHNNNVFMLKKYFPFPYNDINNCYWSFDYGPIHVAIIDQYTDYSVGSAQYTWLDNDLLTTTKKWKFIVLHAPGWSAGKHDNDIYVQNIIQPLCEKYGVSIVFNGHNHNYARALVNGVYHLTIGSSGAILYPVDVSKPNIEIAVHTYHYGKVEINDNILTFYVINNNGTQIDTFTITK